ncbi:hypothetical protein PPL_11703 [Heterostelium album PN500]|uniref:Uncharacterized protein n=1 Tax=Heterostelium pallidum (strain ATCC 26659 / Pp 5 / PN500) TaxID=670386 RepID=D3BU84_HETP5|nr:hypothetical protein PPL_11703 [Heterostelium album PN500]EFA75018.1 hypothetical protein PPL_11703 [Heterostelium album PN500]|eukprot:XP_020427152.1 hypothetical protein PPL_11703 [Heterostelium album PN500]
MYTQTQNLTGYKGKAKEKGADSHAEPKKRYHHPDIDTDQFLVPPESAYKIKKDGDKHTGGEKKRDLWI